MDVDAFDRYLLGRSDADLFAGVVRLQQDRPDGTAVTLLEKGYGLANRAWQIPCAPDIRFDTASITKLFTAVAVLQQVEAEAFELDTSVTDYLGLTGTQISGDVTPYHLLTHTSGIADDADEEAGEKYEDLFRDRPNYAVRETRDFLPSFVHKPPNFAPGQGCRYCNVSYVLLGLMVEQASDLPYREYVADRVFAAAGMADAVFAAMDVVTPRVAEGVELVRDDGGSMVGWRRNIYSYPPIGSPDGGAHVTAADLVAFHDALRQGRLLSPASVAAMLRPHARMRARGEGWHDTGFGFEFGTDAQGTVTSYWKEGSNMGVSAILTHYVQTGITAVILSNTSDGAWEPSTQLDRQLEGT
jgi:CubicO group peptidase (beta-lactamase class C family)